MPSDICPVPASVEYSATFEGGGSAHGRASVEARASFVHSLPDGSDSGGLAKRWAMGNVTGLASVLEDFLP
jgi:hypothetical protein